MDKQLDTYFKKAKESLSEPPPISEVISMLDASPGPQSTNWWMNRRFQVLIAVAVVLIGLFLIQFFNKDAEITVTDKETTDQEITSSQENKSSDVVVDDAESKESTDQEDAPEVSENDAANDPKANDAPVQDDDAVVADVQNDEPPANADTEKTAKDPEVSDEKTEDVSDDTKTLDESGTLNVSKPPPDEEKSDPKPEETAPTADLVTHEKHEIIFKSTDAEIAKLKRKLKKEFGIELTIDAIKRDRGFIIKLNGTVDDLNSKYKMPFKVGGSSFDQFTIKFDYSKADGAQNIDIK